jgi:Mg-dependent DNase
MLVDVHAHLDVEEFDKDREEVLRKCRIVVVNAGVDLKSSMASLNMARSYPNVVLQ